MRGGWRDSRRETAKCQPQERLTVKELFQNSRNKEEADKETGEQGNR